jgi:hypothetical protein
MPLTRVCPQPDLRWRACGSNVPTLGPRSGWGLGADGDRSIVRKIRGALLGDRSDVKAYLAGKLDREKFLTVRLGPLANCYS